MVPNICCFISDRFYQGVLRSGVAPRPSPLKEAKGNLLFVHVPDPERITSQGKYYNGAEIDVIFDMIHKILKEGRVALADIGVICMYSQQVKHILARKPNSLPFSECFYGRWFSRSRTRSRILVHGSFESHWSMRFFHRPKASECRSVSSKISSCVCRQRFDFLFGGQLSRSRPCSSKTR